MVVAIVVTGIFLPVRLLFYTYVSQYWLGSLGLVSAIAILLFVLVRKKKLGRFGKLFEKQMSKSAHGKLGKIFLSTQLLSIILFVSLLFFIDRGDTYWLDDRDRFFAAIISSGNLQFYDELKINGLPLPSTELLLQHDQMTPDQRNEILTHYVSNHDFMLSTIMALNNTAYHGWFAHFLIVALVGDIESLCLFFFYRHVYKKQKIESWHP